MRRLVLLCCAAVLVGCAKKEAEPAADTTAAAPPAPAMLTAADVAGKWSVVVMPETSDSVVTQYEMTATTTDTGWVVMLPNRPAMTPRVMFSGDSVVVDMGPFESVLRKGVQVTTHSVSRLQGGLLVGMTTAHYATKSGDSVAMLRTRGTRVP
ncbi:MAG TPA: hypothetical protein VGQ69_11830 [Gemmatimonadales bacterium]|jgi:hypothetical protein|nr:hypothetical protein [Gemmatimonadales bacterium]